MKLPAHEAQLRNTLYQISFGEVPFSMSSTLNMLQSQWSDDGMILLLPGYDAARQPQSVNVGIALSTFILPPGAASSGCS